MKEKRQLYTILLIACLIGYGWLFIVDYYHVDGRYDSIRMCLFNYATDYPCPSCGSTRFIHTLLHGQYTHALTWNVLGIIPLLGMLTIPPWILYDTIMKRDSLYNVYLHIQTILKHKWAIGILITLIMANWIWNVYKGI